MVSGVSQNVDVALIMAVGQAAEKITNHDTQGFKQAEAQFKNYAITALPIVLAGGLPPPLHLNFSFALSAQGHEQIDLLAGTPQQFLSNIATTLVYDLVTRVTQFYVQFKAVQSTLSFKYGSVQPKNLEYLDA